MVAEHRQGRGAGDGEQPGGPHAATGGPGATTRGADLVGRHRGLFGRTALVSGLTLVSRVLGYVREMISAALFGDRSAVYDAFITAWRVPNLFRRFLGEGALGTSFQTALTEVDGNHGEETGRRLFLDTLRLATLILVGLCLVVMGLARLVPDEMPFTGWRWLGADPEPVRDLVGRLDRGELLLTGSRFWVLPCCSSARE